MKPLLSKRAGLICKWKITSLPDQSKIFRFSLAKMTHCDLAQNCLSFSFCLVAKNTLDKCLIPVALMNPNCAKNNCEGCNSFLLHLIQPTVLDSPIQKGWVCQRNKNKKSKRLGNLSLWIFFPDKKQWNSLEHDICLFIYVILFKLGNI